MSLVSDNVRHSFQLQEAQHAFLRFFDHESLLGC